jgi:hypothetical protein
MGQSLNHGKPVTMPEMVEMQRRFATGQSVNYIANAMGRSWTSVNRRGLTWVETRNPKHSPEHHLATARFAQQRLVRARRQRKEVDECLYFIGPWL